MSPAEQRLMEKESTLESVELRSSGSSGDQKSTSSEPRLGASVRGVCIQPQGRIFGENILWKNRGYKVYENCDSNKGSKDARNSF